MQPAKSPSAPPLRTRRMGALRHGNYRLYFIGQAISTAGTWMQSVAMPWLALTLTHDAFHVGLVLATQFTPMLVAGRRADLLPRQRGQLPRLDRRPAADDESPLAGEERPAGADAGPDPGGLRLRPPRPGGRHPAAERGGLLALRDEPLHAAADLRRPCTPRRTGRLRLPDRLPGRRRAGRRPLAGRAPAAAGGGQRPVPDRDHLVRLPGR